MRKNVKLIYKEFTVKCVGYIFNFLKLCVPLYIVSLTQFFQLSHWWSTIDNQGLNNLECSSLETHPKYLDFSRTISSILFCAKSEGL